jgi:glutathione peroxidase
VLGFACNQFGLQENSDNEEILDMVKHIRPGGGFEPNFPIFEKIICNGADQSDIWKILQQSVPEWDPTGRKYLPSTNLSPSALSTVPCGNGDTQWNFEKFLVDREGYVAFRAGFDQMPNTLNDEIEEMLK